MKGQQGMGEKIKGTSAKSFEVGVAGFTSFPVTATEVCPANRADPVAARKDGYRNVSHKHLSKQNGGRPGDFLHSECDRRDEEDCEPADKHRPMSPALSLDENANILAGTIHGKHGWWLNRVTSLFREYLFALRPSLPAHPSVNSPNLRNFW